jgi:anthranilate synthase component II
MSRDVLMVDNHDSFTFNIVEALERLGASVRTVRNEIAATDAFEQARETNAIILISPGPGRPEEAGCSMELIALAKGKMPLLGVCLGHQALGVAAGAVVERAAPVHGKASMVHHTGGGIFEGVRDPFEAARYHSLVVRREPFPAELELTAWSDDGLVMGAQHRTLPRFGVQFHPESILTPDGPKIVRNFLALARSA